MSFGKILDTLLFGPLRLLFEFIFGQTYALTGAAGWAILLMSLVMNLLLFPLYRRVDKIREENQKMERELQPGVNHIKETFSGQERLMMLQTYYRQNNYKQSYALRGTLSLALELPFFIAAYQFLSRLNLLQGLSFGTIADLSAPDGLLQAGSWQINLLPLLMTAFNVLSGAVFSRESSNKVKIQLYAMAAFFLIFLYNSPSALMLYWTFNNFLSLVKNLLTKKFTGKQAEKKHARGHLPLPYGQIFVVAAIFLTLLIGVLIPSAFISASPEEYIDIYHYEHPALYVLSSFLLAAGVFLIWLPVFYKLMSDRSKRAFARILFIVAGLALANYMFFGRHLGIISSALQYDGGMSFRLQETLMNILVLIVLTLLLVLLPRLISKRVIAIMLVASLALGGMSAFNLFKIKTVVEGIDLSSQGIGTDLEQTPAHFNLSKTGQNVVVMMFDRAMGTMLPYIFNEKPELEEQFAGFTYYPNTISFGNSTNFGVPPLLGGYEYTPVAMNIRDEEKLKDKHNEALKLMPVVFSEHDYDVTVCDPPYANYKWMSDLSIFDGYPEISTYLTKGKFDPDQGDAELKRNHRNFFIFSLIKTMPVAIQPLFYDYGNYLELPQSPGAAVYSVQTSFSSSTARGFRKAFMQSYDVLDNLSSMTKIAKEEDNTFLFLCNDLTHEPMLLQTPDYLPASHVDNKDYDADHSSRFYNKENGRELITDSISQMSHYHANMAMMLQLGQWFNDLRSLGVYDNTRIIIASDHGRDLQQLEELILDYPDGGTIDLESYTPLLLVKDFNSKEFSISDEFMTQADVPSLAFSGLIDKAINPFTGKEINNDEKYLHDQYIILSNIWQVDINNGNTFLPSEWASVKDDIWQPGNWSFYPYDIVLKEHKIA
ncbi:MAG: sulfatase-like hydrolase/transferase [Clostridiaceae bacterium]|nr:sulfatase-like hydrolase/transferase [Clostridiaceae bacterium]